MIALPSLALIENWDAFRPIPSVRVAPRVPPWVYYTDGIFEMLSACDFEKLVDPLEGSNDWLESIILTWRHRLATGQPAPLLVLFLLTTRTQLKLPLTDASATGQDRRIVAYLAPLAKAYGFGLYLARLTHTTTEYCRDPEEGELDKENREPGNRRRHAEKVTMQWSFRCIDGSLVEKPIITWLKRRATRAVEAGEIVGTPIILRESTAFREKKPSGGRGARGHSRASKNPDMDGMKRSSNLSERRLLNFLLIANPDP